MDKTYDGGGGIGKVKDFPWLNKNIIYLSNHCITCKAKNYIILQPYSSLRNYVLATNLNFLFEAVIFQTKIILSLGCEIKHMLQLKTQSLSMIKVINFCKVIPAICFRIPFLYVHTTVPTIVLACVRTHLTVQ